MEQAEQAGHQDWDGRAAEAKPGHAQPRNACRIEDKGAPSDNRAAIPYYVLSETPCPYLKGRFERKLLAEVSGPCGPQRYDLLTRAGSRRSHRFAYRPACHECEACIPVRVPVATFKPSKSLKRIVARNRDLAVIERPPMATQEHFALFKAYLKNRHGDGEMAIMNGEDYRSMIEESDLETYIVEFRRPDRALVAALLMDWLPNGSSAVYSYFSAAEQARSLGIYMVLWLLEATKARGLPHVYLGYWIKESRKMAYKTRFRPIEALGRDGWSIMSDAEATPELECARSWLRS